MKTEEILAERQTTHGEFKDNARMSQNIKRLMEGTKNWQSLEDFQKESLHMIAHKIGRILEGNPHFKDHWDDIAGYAKLVADRVTP